MKKSINFLQRTDHGENIISQLIGEDAYGNSESLTISDAWGILDMLETVFMEQGRRAEEAADQMGTFKKALEAAFPDMETVA